MTRYSSRPVPARGLPDRQVRRVARVAEGAPLLREYRVYSSIEGSNPSLSQFQTIPAEPFSSPCQNRGAWPRERPREIVVIDVTAGIPAKFRFCFMPARNSDGYSTRRSDENTYK